MTGIMKAEELLRRQGEPGLVIVDVRPHAAWQESTIPGAICLNVYDYFISSSDEKGIEEMERAVSKAFADTGIDRAAATVYFEERTGMISPRGLWFHDLARRRGGYILDGGIEAWKAVGGSVAAGGGISSSIAIDPLAPQAAPMNRMLVATLAETLGRDADRTDLLDVRRRSEFAGTFAHPCCARAGRIPGAKFLFWEDLLENGHYRDPGTLRSLAREAGLSPARRVITYCHRGARAATAFYALREAGFEDVAIFVGSWHEWAAIPELPLVTGA